MFHDYYSTGVILATGALVAISCALLGTFLVLRRMALVGDAISHAILPGIVLGFLVTQSRHPLVMLVGAAVAGLLTVWLIELLQKNRQVHEDTSIAVVFPALFALGVVLLNRFGRYVDLDPDCVIYGQIEYAPRKPLVLMGVELGPRSLWILGLMTFLNILFVASCFKELKLCTFDPGLAQALGYSPKRMHYVLMGAVSLTTVAAFEAVGAVIVVAFLIVPAAIAYLLTDRLWLLLMLASAFGLASVVGGYMMASEFALNTTVAGGMATVAGLLFLFVWLIAPRHGLLATMRRRWRLRRRFAGDLLLLHLRKSGEFADARGLVQGRFRWSSLYSRYVLRHLRRRGLVSTEGDRIALTSAGASAAERLTQAYRP